MIIAVLIVLGLCLGSFINAYTWRIYKQTKSKSQKYSISKGRSMCIHCGHELAASDLLPVVSWVYLKGKCRYCHKPISVQYPAVELLTAVLFVVSYVFWPDPLSDILAWVVFATWLLALVMLISLVVYDIKWMLLPNRIILPLAGMATFLCMLRILDSGSIDPLWQAAASILVGGGFFYILFQVSSGKWIGGGDVKLGFVLGLLIMNPLQAGLMLFLASLLGFLAILPFMATGKLSPKARIPFGPFLITATFIVVLFGKEIIDWYQRAFLII